MSTGFIRRLLGPTAALLAVSAMTACGNASASTAGQPAPPEANGPLARGDVLTRVQIARINAQSMADLIDGRFAGVQVRRVGGMSRVLIRGQPDPLVVLDGAPLADPQELWMLDPNDIERIQILKGEGAVLYGSRGGHGVVVITTRIQ